ncbi:carcinine hydrolase/isopenicillin-N N-acyltransferase family protein [Phocaeicola oris]|uniref:carcinine hydrolase/isopenicillin-N N-acyltransferase family protein n=1 Tax=Phocaeicola oris TaxID=2896850 RepID=UPI00234E847C|nr:carcinine hydrolase/isopenicillin-N N-acyltransferase family protein [Phocaeicola oris]MCE2615958.1 carcinine hydrolase/isopenicillin-N N-acyltransferase family protein [Phocaeicola oris]
MNTKRLFFLIFAILLLSVNEISACTSFIVSGRVTADGRPMIFKNRDADNLSNMSLFVKGEKYNYIGIVAGKTKEVRDVWVGHNEAGFAIFNTAAYNLNDKEDGPIELDGEVMRRALEICASLSDFENMLDTLQRPMLVDSNFGVIDANGGCAYYEVGNSTYVKFDANDPNIAPYGYLVRTNHGFSGDRSKDKGIERYMAISEVMMNAEYSNNLNAEYLITNVPRTLKHGLTKIDIRDFMPESANETRFFPFHDYISRSYTSCSVLIQGVKKGENPLLTVSWTIVGNPLTTVAVPLVITSTHKLPQVITKGEDGCSSLCEAGLRLKNKLFPLRRGSATDYINIAALINKEGTGILQQILPVEKEIIRRGDEELRKIRSAGKTDTSIEQYYDWVNQYIKEKYKQIFGLEL